MNTYAMIANTRLQSSPKTVLLSSSASPMPITHASAERSMNVRGSNVNAGE
ncbi:MAG: hypothetical protein WKH64_04005 [Chloroflexia bacterium]